MATSWRLLHSEYGFFCTRMFSVCFANTICRMWIILLGCLTFKIRLKFSEDEKIRANFVLLFCLSKIDSLATGLHLFSIFFFNGKHAHKQPQKTHTHTHKVLVSILLCHEATQFCFHVQKKTHAS